MLSLSTSTPRIDRLFHVLVVLGAASCGGDDGTTTPRDLTVDAAEEAPVVDAAVSADGAVSELAPCFCNADACCDRSASPAVIAPGFECCWSTTCP